MRPFTHVGLPSRILFGDGRLDELKAEIARLGATRALFCCTAGRRAEVAALAERVAPLSAGVCAAAKIFVPIEVAREGRAAAREAQADALIAYGGGTAIGLAKAIALELHLPIIAAVTTYSGSEMTSIQGIVTDGVRTTYHEPHLLPKTVIYDPSLMVDLPMALSVPSAFNSMAHGVGAFIGETTNPVSWMYAEEGIRALSSALSRLAADPRDGEARGDALYGAFLTGSTLETGGVWLHHKTVHVLGAGFDLSHGGTHAIVLPHMVGYVRRETPEAQRRIARAFGDEAGDAAGAIFDLLVESGAPSALRDIGMPESGIDEAVDTILAAPRYYSPRPPDRASLRALLDDAWLGKRPQPDG